MSGRSGRWTGVCCDVDKEKSVTMDGGEASEVLVLEGGLVPRLRSTGTS